MLHPLMTGGEEIAVEARHVIALLDELELHIARVGERDRHLEIVGPALIAEFIQWQLLGIEPRADAAHLDPVAHCLLDVAHDDPDLPHWPEQPTHRLLRFLVCTDIRQISAGSESRIASLTGLSNHPPAKLVTRRRV